VENAVKIARRYTGRPTVIVMDNAFHGRTNLTMSMTTKASPYKRGFGPFAPDVVSVPYSYPLRDSFGTDGVAAAKASIKRMELLVGPRGYRGDHRRAGAGRGRLHRAGGWVPQNAVRLGA
jgi:4-aminobutyrate aminotransferase/(S)-3-amino-2-methylpropionate transaminase